MNEKFEDVGKAFAAEYYDKFDRKATRHMVAGLYQPNIGMLTFEGKQFQGRDAIGPKLQDYPLSDIQRIVSTIDCQPMLDGGILVAIVGQLQNEGDKPLPFSQTFILRWEGGNYWLFHDIFRLALHNC